MPGNSVQTARLFLLGLLGVYLAGLFFPSGILWGIHFLGFLPLGWSIVYVAFALALIFFLPGQKVPKIIVLLSTNLDKRLWLFLGGALTAIVGWAVIFHVRVPLLGDSFYLIKNYMDSYRGTDVLYPRDEPLATYYFSIVLNALGYSSYEHFLKSFLIGETVLLIGFVVNAFFIVRTLFREPSSRLLAFLFAVSFPYMQLFFGYVETYSVLLYTLSLFVLCVVLVLQKKAPFVIAPVAFLLMLMTHYLAVLLLPGLGILIYHELRRKRSGQIIAGMVVALVLFFIILAAVNFDLERFSSWVPHSHFLSLHSGVSAEEDYSEAYTMFSLFHFTDLLNLLLLLCPAGLFLIASEFSQLKKMLSGSPVVQFLLACLMPVGTFLLVVKFDLGAARDWDVFSPYVLVIALLVSIVWLSHRDPIREKVFLVMTCLTLLNTMLFTFINASEGASLRRYKSFFDRRTLSQNGYYGATLQLSMYYHQTADTRQPATIWSEYVRQFPSDARGYENVVNNLSHRGDVTMNDVSPLLDLWKKNDPNDSVVQSVLLKFILDKGNVTFNDEKFQQAAEWFKALVDIVPTYPKAYNNLGSAYAQLKKYSEASSMFEKAIALDSSYADAYYNLGQLSLDLGNKEKGREALRKAAALGNSSARQLLDQLDKK